MTTAHAQGVPWRQDDAGCGPHVRQVLGAAAVTAGLGLAPAGVDGALSEAQARQCALQWGILEAHEQGRDPRRGGGVVVVLVDGLGLEMLQERKGHAPRLRTWLAEARAGAEGLGPGARTCVPSTTAAALTTIGTGALPGVTGMVGYSVLNPLIDRRKLVGREPQETDNLSLITWQGRAPDPRAWQDVPTIFQRLERRDQDSTEAQERQVLSVTVGPARFAGSGLTQAGLRGAVHLGADRMEDRAHLAAGALRRGVPLVYLYVGELDHAGHLHGWRSQRWLTELERLDGLLSELVRKVPAGTRVVLTADHGMVDTDADHRIEVTDHADLARDVVALAGEPRLTQLYVPAARADLAEQVAQRWREHLGRRAAWVGTRAQASELLGPVGARARSVLGDVLVAMAGTWVVVDARVHSQAARQMPGVHGSITSQEMTVPLLVTRA